MIIVVRITTIGEVGKDVDIIRMVTRAVNETPPAKPSKPSDKFMALP
jgi:hypothetical protein